MKVLDVGSGKNSNAAGILSIPEGTEYELTTLDANPTDEPDYVHDITEEFPANLLDAFDLVVCSHVLEHIPRIKVPSTFKNIHKTVKNMGELWVLVPSMEWAAREIVEGRHSLAVEANVFGSQMDDYQYHKCSFTLSALRHLFDEAGLLVKKAYQSPYLVAFDNVEQLCIQNIVIGARVDGLGEKSV